MGEQWGLLALNIKEIRSSLVKLVRFLYLLELWIIVLLQDYLINCCLGMFQLAFLWSFHCCLFAILKMTMKSTLLLILFPYATSHIVFFPLTAMSWNVTVLLLLTARCSPEEIRLLHWNVYYGSREFIIWHLKIQVSFCYSQRDTTADQDTGLIF